MEGVYVAGVGMTAFGKHPDRTAADLAAEAILGALDDAGVKMMEIEAAWVGHVYQGMAMGQRALGAGGLSGLPITNVENACSSGSTAIFEAATALRAGAYVQAMIAMGGGSRRAVFRHSIPNVVGTVVVNATFQVADAIMLVAYLSFLGLGVPLPHTDWGGMLSNGLNYSLDGYWWMIIPPGIAIVLVELVAVAMGA